MLLAGGGRVIKRADVDVNGALANRLQMTASYAAGEGLGRSFVLTPDEAQIVSAGLFFVGGAVNAYKQHAFVTTADGSQDDTQLHPNLVHPLDGAGLPLVTANSRYGYYVYRVNFVDHLGWADLQAPGTNTGVLTAINPFSKILLAGDSQHVFLEASEGGIEPWKLVENVSTPVFNGFNPVGGGVSAPREGRSGAGRHRSDLRWRSRDLRHAGKPVHDGHIAVRTPRVDGARDEVRAGFGQRCHRGSR